MHKFPLAIFVSSDDDHVGKPNRIAPQSAVKHAIVFDMLLLSLCLDWFHCYAIWVHCVHGVPWRNQTRLLIVDWFQCFPIVDVIKLHCWSNFTLWSMSPSFLLSQFRFTFTEWSRFLGEAHVNTSTCVNHLTRLIWLNCVKVLCCHWSFADILDHVNHLPLAHSGTP